jgi:hypothetical protein
MSHEHAPPHIDYLARDFAGFRQLLLDHLSVLTPGWEERSAADQGNALIDLLAYAADYMSYYQDAAATEMYLGTARLRRSARRHAQLLDYHLHDGCNARLWAYVELHARATQREGILLPKGTQLLTAVEGDRPPAVFLQGGADYADTLAQAPLIFETMHDARLFPEHNEITFARQGSFSELPNGAISAVLAGDLPNLAVGDVLIFEEVRGAATGRHEDANPAHRHAVRLTRVEPQPGGHGGQTAIAWHAEDALPFSLILNRDFGGSSSHPICVARGNVVLADHGRTIVDEELPLIPQAGRYRPRLQLAGLTQAVPYDHAYARTACSAAATLAQSSAEAMPAITLIELWPRPVERAADQAPLLTLKEHRAGSGRFFPTKPWTLRRDLLSSGSLAREYIIEMEDGGVAYLRFGFADGGWQPAVVDARLLATYRIGGGSTGNVSQDAIAYIAVDPNAADPDIVVHIRGARNPLTASGGANPERTEAARLHAPHAFRTWEPPDGAEGDYSAQAFKAQARCITAEDYASIAVRHPDVAEAVAELRWTGSWQTVVVYARRRGGLLEDHTFREELRAFLEPYRLAGYDVTVAPPCYVPLDVALHVYPLPGRRASLLRSALFEALDGSGGFFAPAGFGIPVHRSRLVARVAAVDGVDWVDITRFRRDGADRVEEHIAIGPLEIARLDIAAERARFGRFSLKIEGAV